ncbi:SPFH domain-containing protein [Catelliglobosispora koreensis]|uniref:hypothetical protein n=1 Tax=Catelliglobosispora koreensis TaxID=129052 RepID=UPI000372F85A|nr:hypothetical protein [Catelliglobosispora koreensis]
MADASGAIDTMMSAILAARAEAERLGIPVLDDRILMAYHRAAAPVLLAAERERIAQQILRAASTLPADALSARGHAEWAAEIARGSVAGKPDTQGGHP